MDRKPRAPNGCHRRERAGLFTVRYGAQLHAGTCWIRTISDVSMRGSLDAVLGYSLLSLMTIFVLDWALSVIELVFNSICRTSYWTDAEVTER